MCKSIKEKGVIITDSIVKFSFVALCLTIALCSRGFCHSKKDWGFLVSAMGFTLMSDFFLVLLHNYRMGVFLFCFVHVFYIFRVRGSSDKIKKRLAKINGAIFIMAMVVFAIFAFAPFLPQFDPLVVLAVVYASFFVQNLIVHVKYYRSNDPEALPMLNRRLMLAGLILFALCDINVLLFNLPNHVPFPQAVADLGLSLIWVFYAPSQLLLSVSAVNFRRSV